MREEVIYDSNHIFIFFSSASFILNRFIERIILISKVNLLIFLKKLRKDYIKTKQVNKRERTKGEGKCGQKEMNEKKK